MVLAVLFVCRQRLDLFSRRFSQVLTLEARAEASVIIGAEIIRETFNAPVKASAQWVYGTNAMPRRWRARRPLSC